MSEKAKRIHEVIAVANTIVSTVINLYLLLQLLAHQR